MNFWSIQQRKYKLGSYQEADNESNHRSNVREIQGYALPQLYENRNWGTLTIEQTSTSSLPKRLQFVLNDMTQEHHTDQRQANFIPMHNGERHGANFYCRVGIDPAMDAWENRKQKHLYDSSDAIRPLYRFSKIELLSGVGL